MMVIIMRKVPEGLKGELTRWLIQPHSGVFVGNVSAMVRDRLWELCCKSAREGGIIQLWSTNTEQRFTMRTYGDTAREMVDMDGMLLVMRKPLPSDAP